MKLQQEEIKKQILSDIAEGKISAVLKKGEEGFIDEDEEAEYQEMKNLKDHQLKGTRWCHHIIIIIMLSRPAIVILFSTQILAIVIIFVYYNDDSGRHYLFHYDYLLPPFLSGWFIFLCIQISLIKMRRWQRKKMKNS